MGNRAVIAFAGDLTPPSRLALALTQDLHPDLDPEWTGIYLQWNGGIESVKAFLDAANKLGVRHNDGSYTPARLCQIIGNFFGGATSLGVGPLRSLDCDNGDNGVFVVNDKMQIVKRVYSDEGLKVADKKKYKSVMEQTIAKSMPFYEKELADAKDPLLTAVRGVRRNP